MGLINIFEISEYSRYRGKILKKQVVTATHLCMRDVSARDIEVQLLLIFLKIN